MSFDLGATLRRLKPEKRTGQLTRRGDSELPFVGEEAIAGPGVLLDTTVYVDLLQDRLPAEVERLFDSRMLNHSAVALAELVHLFGRLDPAHPGTARTLAPIRAAIEQIPPYRLTAPSTQALAEAGIITGMVARMVGVARTDRQPLLNDATLFVQALESGFTLLSGNVADMDLIGQLQPHTPARFVSVTMEQALTARHDREALLNKLRQSLEPKATFSLSGPVSARPG